MGQSNEFVHDRRVRRRDVWRHLKERIVEVVRELRYLAPRDTCSGAAELPVHVEGQLMKDYHRIEKALAFRDPRRDFGVEPKQRLARDLERAQDLPVQAWVKQAASQVVKAHNLWTEEGIRATDADGVIQKVTSEIRRRAILEDPEGFFFSRHSIRNFDETRPPPVELLKRAVRLAQSTPSVCNRQAVSVNLYTDPDKVQRVLELQSGSRGFREVVPAVYVVHVDTRLFMMVGERNQKWVDGGLFAMTLALAAHSLGLSTCMLNWAVTNDVHQQMRDLIGLPDYEDVVVLIAVGYAPEEVLAARSLRRDLDEILTVDGPIKG